MFTVTWTKRRARVIGQVQGENTTLVPLHHHRTRDKNNSTVVYGRKRISILKYSPHIKHKSFTTIPTSISRFILRRNFYTEIRNLMPHDISFLCGYGLSVPLSVLLITIEKNKQTNEQSLLRTCTGNMKSLNYCVNRSGCSLLCIRILTTSKSSLIRSLK